MNRLGAGYHIRCGKLDRASLQTGLRRLLDPAVTGRATDVGRAIAERDGTLVADRGVG